MKKKLSIVLMISLILICALAMFFYAAGAQDTDDIQTGFAGGDGSYGNPYLISTPEHLIYLSQNAATLHKDTYTYFALTNDITLNDESFLFDADTGLVKVSDGEHTAFFGTGILGKADHNTLFDITPSIKGTWYANDQNETISAYEGELIPFTPIEGSRFSFDGGGYTISGLYIHTKEDNAALFTEASSIRNLMIENSFIYNEGQYTGSVVGNGKQSSLEGISSDAIVIGNDYVGGIAAQASYVNICTFDGTVIGNDYVGGIAGGVNSAYICAFDGSAYGNFYVGGITAKTEYLSSSHTRIIALSSSSGSIHAARYAGGIVGLLTSNSHVENCYNYAAITAQSIAGGIAGKTETRATVAYCHHAKTVRSETNFCGNIVGQHQGVAEYCYYAGNAYQNNSRQNGIGTDTQSSVKQDIENETTMASSHSQSSYTYFDFSEIWYMDINIPRLRSEIQLIFPMGYGSAQSPYLVKTAAQLQTVSAGGELIKDKHFKLIDDITLNDETFTFDSDTGLVKVSDGKHTAYLGTGFLGDTGGDNTVFDTVSSQRNTWYVSDLSTEKGTYTGSLESWSTAFDVYQCALFDGNGHTVSGLYGHSLFAYINGTVFDLHIQNALITNFGSGSFSQVSIGHIKNCSSSAIVLGRGGITEVNSGTISETVFDGYVIQINANDEDTLEIGGIAGNNTDGIIERCRNKGTVLGNYYVGGIAGNAGTILNCANQGNIYATHHFAGGIAGVALESAIVRNCYSTGKIYSSEFVGGILGYISLSTIENCYYQSGSAANAEGGVHLGIGSYYNKESSQTEQYPGDDLGKTTALSDEQMQKKDSFAGFDFDNVFSFAQNAASPYPVLLFELPQNDASAPSILDQAAEWFAAGNGTENDPYLIQNASELILLAKLTTDGQPLWGEYFALTTDIALNDTSLPLWFLNATPWVPIGNRDTSFGGIFDGNGHTISGVYMNSLYEAGLFGHSIGMIVNLNIADSYIDSSQIAGGIVAINVGTIRNCHSDITLSGYQFLGGIVGINELPIYDCTFTGNIFAHNNAGGIAGINQSTITNCQNSAAISGNVSGGIAGINHSTITNCQNSGTISGDGNGGIAGRSLSGEISDCVNHGSVNGRNSGGIVGTLSGALITNCQNTASISGGGICYSALNGASILGCQNSGNIQNNYNAGGICSIFNGKLLALCHNSGNIEAQYYAGGIAGTVQGKTENCYNSGKITAIEYAGGITGFAGSAIESCYNIGKVSGNRFVGGIAGHASATLTDCYYLDGCANDGTATQNAVGHTQNGSVTEDTGSNTAALTLKQFSEPYYLPGFDFTNIWMYENDLPALIALHPHTFDQKVISDQYLKTAADCQNPTVYYYSCQCGECGTETFTEGTYGDHIPVWQSDSSCHYTQCSVCSIMLSHAQHVYTNDCDTECNVCGHTRKITHNYVYIPDGTNSEKFHLARCTVCLKQEAPREMHSFATGVIATPASEASHGVMRYTCKDCGYIKTELIHYYTYVQYETGHTNVCLHCQDEKEEMAPHRFEGEVTTPSTPAAEGKITYTCSDCGYQKTETEHYYAYAVGDTGHYYACVHCGTIREKEAAHIFDEGRITAIPTYTDEGETTYTCTVCGHEKTEPIGTLPPVSSETTKDPTENDSASVIVSAENQPNYMPVFIVIALAMVCNTALMGYMFLHLLKKEKVTQEKDGEEEPPKQEPKKRSTDFI
ncbi:MAG: hypothetical protein E7616_07150 [Ruminococcaceae bacterium]|nr:hypothetical protein [Oscillospiraceae bacterium]